MFVIYLLICIFCIFLPSIKYDTFCVMDEANGGVAFCKEIDEDYCSYGDIIVHLFRIYISHFIRFIDAWSIDES